MNGGNYTINNLTQTFSGNATVYSGLFERLEGGISGSYRYGYVYNVGLINVNISVDNSSDMLYAELGAIAGKMNNTTITNSFASGEITDNRDKPSNVGKNLYIGGLVGLVVNSTIDASYANMDVTGTFWNYIKAE